MSTIKNDQISLYCHFIKIKKRPGTSFQPPVVNQKYVRKVCHTEHQYLTKFHFDSAQDPKEISISVTSIMQQCYDDVTDFEIRAFYKNRTISISRERNMIFSSNKKNHQLHIKRQFVTKNSFVAEVTFKVNNRNTRSVCEIYSKLAIKTQEQLH